MFGLAKNGKNGFQSYFAGLRLFPNSVNAVKFQSLSLLRFNFLRRIFLKGSNFKIDDLIYFHFKKADITNLYRNTLAKHSVDYTGKSLKGVNKLLISNKTARDKKLKEDLDKEKVDKESWKKTFVPVYFQSEWGKNFLEGIPNKESNFLQTSENLFMHNTTDDNSLINLKKQAQVKLKMDEPPNVDRQEKKQKKDIKFKDNQQENKGLLHF